jgi:hypothetical protein
VKLGDDEWLEAYEAEAIASAKWPEAGFPSLGFKVAKYIEDHMVFGPGDSVGEPLRLKRSWLIFLVWLYRLDPHTGRRVFREAQKSAAKGDGKSTLGAAIHAAEVGGPVRFSHWAANGKPEGRPVKSPVIRVLATEEGQTGNVYDTLRIIAEYMRSAGVAPWDSADIGKTRILLPDGGKVIPSTSGAVSKDGGIESNIGEDEPHLYYTPELIELDAVVRRNAYKRTAAEPWILQMTTRWEPGRQSVAEQTFEAGKKWRSLDDMAKSGLLIDHREGFPVENLEDGDAVRASLMRAYGNEPAGVDIDGLVQMAADPRTAPNAFRRYYLNQIAAGSGRWLDRGTVDAAERDGKIEDGAQVALGFDGSRWDDHTGLIAIDSTGLIEVVGHWVAGDMDPDDLVASVNSTLEDAFKRFKVARMYADPPKWESDIARWAQRHDPKRVLPWDTRTRQMQFAIDRFALELRSGELGHTGDKTLVAHLLNAVTHETRVELDDTGRTGVKLAKVHNHSSDKIDLGVAAVVAAQARRDAIKAGQMKLGERRKARVRF